MSVQNGGNANQLGVINVKTTKMLGPNRPGTVTRGPGSNKPRIHLVSGGGKIPAGVYAEAIAQKQRMKANPSGSNGSRTDPNLKGSHTSNPRGVKPYPVKPASGLT